MGNEPSDPGRIGRVPDGYQLVRELSRDGPRFVYLAEDRARGGLVTLTALGRPEDPGGLARLAHEMDALAGLRHPGVLPVHVIGDADGRAYLVSPAVEDPDLAEWLSAWGPLSITTALPLMREVADALDAAHLVGVVHGGVRPAIVRIAAGTGRPYLTGFGGIAGQADVGYQAPEQAIGAPADRRTDVYAFGGLLFRCLTGVAPPHGGGPGAVSGAAPPRVSAYRPDLPGELDRVVATAMARDPAFRFDTCRAVVEATAAAAGMGAVPPLPNPVTARPRRINWRVVLAVLVVVALLGAGALVAPHVAAAMWPTSDNLARVPAAVRGDCDLADPDPRLPDAQRQLRCTDGEGQDVLVGLFADATAADAAYRGLVASDPAVQSGTGDCERGTGFEHRYPGVGDFRGRVLCDRVGSAARLAWFEHSNRTVAISERADGNAAELYRSWSDWLELPAFPTAQEQQLLDVMFEESCQRAPAGPLDGLDGVVAALECAPKGTGASTVTYYRFPDRETLRRAYDSDVASYGAGSGVSCLNAAGPGDTPYIRVVNVEVGRLTCGGAAPALTWTADALLIMGRATGADRAGLIAWWRSYSGPAWRPSIDAINRQSTPPFPTAEENRLLQQIPDASRVGCARPSTEMMRAHVGDASVVGVMCTTTTGPEAVYYYKYSDAQALNMEIGPASGPGCTTAPPGSVGAALYTRPDGSTGTLTCGTNEAGYGVLKWTDDQTSILGYAFDPDPARLMPWWHTAAGPL